MEKLILVDASGLIYRGFYAIPPFLKSPAGIQTNAVFGFTNILLSLLINQRPDYMAVAFDKKGPTFRHKEFKEYKATRVKAPQELYDQIPLVHAVVSTFKMSAFEAQGFEADDILATIVKQVSGKKNLEIFVSTGDFDLFQLAGVNVAILAPTKGFKEAQIIRAADIEKTYGFSPKQIPDYKGLVGDASDNIPGVKGIGPKSAAVLLSKYHFLENVYDHLSEIEPGIGKKLKADRQSAFESKKLTQLREDVPLTFELGACKVSNLDTQAAKKIFEELGFKSLLKRLGELENRNSEQLSIFG